MTLGEKRLYELCPPLIRPPSEADSLIIQATYGCSHNRCAFCVTYRGRPFKARPLDDVAREIDEATPFIRGARRVFLGDGDPLALSTDRLLPILGLIRERLPAVRRITAYASPGNFKNKSTEEIARLGQAGLTQVYMGFESGDDEILRRIDKGATHDEMVAACDKLHAAGIKISAILILGLGGPALSMRHAEGSARLVNRTVPRFLSALTLVVVPGNRRFQAAFSDAAWRELTPVEILGECRRLIDGIEANGIIFRANHVSNYLPLEGTLQKSKSRLLAELDAGIGDDSHRRLGFGL